jgi:hypothetical protein
VSDKRAIVEAEVPIVVENRVTEVGSTARASRRSPRDRTRSPSTTSTRAVTGKAK